MRYFVYILRNTKGRYYVGHTQDLNARLKEHNLGSVPSTSRTGPWRVESFCCFREKDAAVKFEKYLKSGSGVSFRQRHLIQ